MSFELVKDRNVKEGGLLVCAALTLLAVWLLLGASQSAHAAVSSGAPNAVLVKTNKTPSQLHGLGGYLAAESLEGQRGYGPDSIVNREFDVLSLRSQADSSGGSSQRFEAEAEVSVGFDGANMIWTLIGCALLFLAGLNARKPRGPRMHPPAAS